MISINGTSTRQRTSSQWTPVSMSSSLVRGAKNELYQYVSYANASEDAELADHFKQRWSRVSPCDTSLSLEKFQLIRTLGRGSFGRVVLALQKTENHAKTDGNKFYAIKVMDKRKLVRYKQIDHTLNERRVLFAVQHPNTVRYFFSFKDNSFLYLSLEYISGNDCLVTKGRVRTSMMDTF